MSGRAVRAAVVGLRHGHIGEFARAARDTDGIELAGIAEDVERLSAPAAERWNVPVYADYRELLDREQPDVVGLAVTNAQKAAVAAECLSRGVHVIADKPLLTDFDGLRRLQEALALGRAQLSLMLTCRFGGGYCAIAELIKNGRLGQVVHIAAFGPHRLRPASREPWMLRDDESGGVLVDLGIHYLDLLRWYVGEEPLRITAAQGNMRFPELTGFTDHGHALVTFPSGAVGYVSVDWLTPEASPVHGDYRIFVSGTRGTCELKASDPTTLTLVTDTESPHQVPLSRDQGVPVAAKTPSHDFLEAVRDRRAPLLQIEDILRSSELGLWARQAAQSGQSIDMERSS